MGASIYDLSTTPGSNTIVDGISQAENVMVPSSVNDAFRALDAILARWANDRGAVNTVGGTGDAVTVTLSSGITAYATGQTFRFIAGAANTGAATMNVNSIGIKAIRKISGGTDVALSAGDIAAGETYLVRYSASANAAAGAWIIVGAAAVAAATTSAAGIVELATDAETQALADTLRAVTPSNIAALVATQANQETGTATDRLVTPGRQRFHQSAAKAWGYVTFPGGTPTLQDSYGVTSLTDLGAGNTQVNLSITMSTSTYPVLISADSAIVFTWIASKGTTSFILRSANSSSVDTDAAVSFAVFGDI